MAETVAGCDTTFPDLACCVEAYVFQRLTLWTPGLSKLINNIEREDATKESDFTLDDEDDDDDEENDWDGDVEWDENEVEAALDDDVADESAAYLDFLNQEAQKFGSFADDDD